MRAVGRPQPNVSSSDEIQPYFVLSLPQMVNESFDTTTNRAGDKVNLPPSNPFALAK